METSVSLLERLRTRPDEASWRRLHDLYAPLIRRWLLRDPTLRDEADDLLQDVMTALVQALPTFERERSGSFRRWLRTLTVHRLQGFWRSRNSRPRPQPGPSADSLLAQLEDAGSALSRRWDQEHDQHVIHRLLELIEPEFEPNTLRVFRRLVFEEVEPARVASECGLAYGTVLNIRSRVLSRLRQEAKDFLT
jgi:RNA polymerase sigma-70 factor (ECF subfamily)